MLRIDLHGRSSFYYTVFAGQTFGICASVCGIAIPVYKYRKCPPCEEWLRGGASHIWSGIDVLKELMSCSLHIGHSTYVASMFCSIGKVPSMPTGNAKYKIPRILGNTFLRSAAVNIFSWFFEEGSDVNLLPVRL